MKKLFLILLLATSIRSVADTIRVNNKGELNNAIANARPGDRIVMASGVWVDTEIRFKGEGTSENPITIAAEKPGAVILTGKSDLKFGGEYLIVDGLYFKNGYSPSSAVVAFRIDAKTIASHCRFTNCVIEDFNKPQRDMTDLWVQFHGRNNQVDHCYIAGKSNRGPTIRVDLEGIESIENHHKIVNNHFGRRPPKGGPSGETIQIGNSSTSMSPSYTLVANNLFEGCDGEVEIISNKSNSNEFRNNVFYHSMGSLVTRHGNYCKIDGNYFIGDGKNANVGGIRIIGTGHWVTNNYFVSLIGENFRSPLAVMNGIPQSSQNRYTQVTDLVVAYNSWINCKSPLQFGVGVNIDQKEVLPPSEIRSARPIRSTVANNIIYNKIGDPNPIVSHDKIDGVTFESNVINNQQTDFDKADRLIAKAFEITSIADNIVVPSSDFSDIKPYIGFDFETITKDLFGNSRAGHSSLGAIIGGKYSDPKIIDKSKYGASWFSNELNVVKPKTWSVKPGDDLQTKIAKATAGDILLLAPGKYNLKSPLVINKEITIQSVKKTNKASIVYMGEAKTPAFQMHPKGNLKLNDVELVGMGTQYAFASLEKNMSSLYNLFITGCTISKFDFILKAYKNSFSEYVSFNSTLLKDCQNGIELAAENDDHGDYNAENLTIATCQFENIGRNVIDYYRGGYDESTVGGALSVTHSTFTQCGQNEETKILINTYGIINVAISDNTFQNNPVAMVAQLWGAKNNVHSNNTISNSGKIVVEENLKLKLIY